MWCAGENATVREYVDKAGAMHKIITFAPQPGLTPEMAIFYQSGSFPLNVDVNGKVGITRARPRQRMRVWRVPSHASRPPLVCMLHAWGAGPRACRDVS